MKFSPASYPVSKYPTLPFFSQLLLFSNSVGEKVYGHSGRQCYLANVVMWESQMMDSEVGDSRYSPRV